MSKLQLNQFRDGERVRHIGEQGVQDGLLLASGMVGHVLRRSQEDDCHGIPSYLITFGGRTAWVCADLLRRE
jgi:hypothetical protein